MMVKSGLVFYLEILLAPLELPANLPGQFSLSGKLFLHWDFSLLIIGVLGGVKSLQSCAC